MGVHLATIYLHGQKKKKCIVRVLRRKSGRQENRTSDSTESFEENKQCGMLERAFPTSGPGEVVTSERTGSKGSEAQWSSPTFKTAGLLGTLEGL